MPSWNLMHLQRITPAYAGRINTKKSLFGKGKDHPRIRGKNENSVGCKAEIKGSPPHTREECGG